MTPVDAGSSPSEPVGAPATGSTLGEILTLDEVAGYLKISKKTVYKLVRSGILPAFKVGKHWRVPQADLGAWIARRSRECGGRPK